MSLRCGCPAEGDEIVFGPVHECTADPSLKVERPTPWWQPRPYEPPEPLYHHVLGPDDLDPGEG